METPHDNLQQPDSSSQNRARKVIKAAHPFWKRLLIALLTATLSAAVPGVGQLINRHWIKGVVLLVLGLVFLFSPIGWLIRFVAFVDAASWSAERTGRQYAK